MRISLTNLLFFALLVLFTLPSFSQTYKGKQKDIDQILKNINLFSQYFVNEETEKLVNCYTEDGKIFPGGTKIMAGKNDLMDYWKLSGDAKVTFHKITPEEITIVKKVAYDYGYYEGTTRTPDGNESSWEGKYVIIWHKVGKEWKIYLDIWNRVRE